MPTKGYTLIELLVVVSIIALLGLIGFANLKGFGTDQVVIRAAGQLQTYLRLAQSNATTSTLCNNQGTTSWSLTFLNDARTIELHCDPGTYLQKTYTLENARVAITGDSECTLPVTISYAVGVGTQSLSSSGTPCLQSSAITFTLTNALNSASTKSFKVSKGGAIDVQ